MRFECKACLMAVLFELSVIKRHYWHQNKHNKSTKYQIKYKNIYSPDIFESITPHSNLIVKFFP